MIPNDPVMLLSYINTQLRDNYSNIEALLDGLDISQEDYLAIEKKLNAIGYTYDKDRNTFA